MRKLTQQQARASWGKMFHKYTADRTKDEQKHWFMQKVGEGCRYNRIAFRQEYINRKVN